MIKFSTFRNKGFSPVTVGNVTKMQKVSNVGKNCVKTELILPSGVKVTYEEVRNSFTKVVKNTDGTSFHSVVKGTRGNNSSYPYCILLKDRLVNRLLGIESKGFKERLSNNPQFKKLSSPGFAYYE